MSNILDELKEIANARRPQCVFKSALDKLNDSNMAEQLDEALKTGAFSYPTIKAFLARRGITISSDKLGEHKRGLCKCQIQLLKN